MDITIESAGGVASRTVVGGHELRFDQPVEFGGQNQGPSPLDVLAAAAGACAHYYAAAFLHARHYATDGIVVRVHAEKATQGRKRLGRVEVQLTVPAALPKELLPRLEAAVLSCPAWGTLQESPETSLTISRGD